MKGLLRRLRGALGNAMVWAAGWAGFSVIISLLLHSVGFVFPPMPYGEFAFLVARTFAVFGFLTGGAFSLYLGIAGRTKRLEDLSPGRFGIGGGVLAGLSLPMVGVVINAFNGFPLSAWRFAPIAVITALLGGATAFCTIKIAQAADPELQGGSRLDLGPDGDGVPLLLGDERRK